MFPTRRCYTYQKYIQTIISLNPSASNAKAVQTGTRKNQCKGYYCGTSGCSQDNLWTPLRRLLVTCQRYIPLVYSLHDPRGLTSLRIRLLHNLSVPTIVSLQPPVYKVPSHQLLRAIIPRIQQIRLNTRPSAALFKQLILVLETVREVVPCARWHGLLVIFI